MSISRDRPVPAGRPHRALRDLDMRVHDYDRLPVTRETLPAGGLFKPWEPLDHWRGREVPITLGVEHTEFDWGVTSPDGHFLAWDDFFTHCVPVDAADPPAPPAQTGQADTAESPISSPAQAAVPSSDPPWKALFILDARGRTPLFDAAEQGDAGRVRKMIFSLPGTGFYPQRLGLLQIEDNDGVTAADLAERSGHREIAELLRHERLRMEYWE